jgi:hypothetical protein
MHLMKSLAAYVVSMPKYKFHYRSNLAEYKDIESHADMRANPLNIRLRRLLKLPCVTFAIIIKSAA